MTPYQDWWDATWWIIVAKHDWDNHQTAIYAVLLRCFSSPNKKWNHNNKGIYRRGKIRICCSIIKIANKFPPAVLHFYGISLLSQQCLRVGGHFANIVKD